MKKVGLILIVVISLVLLAPFIYAAPPPPRAMFSFDVDENIVNDSIWEMTFFNINGMDENDISELEQLFSRYSEIKNLCGRTSDYLTYVGLVMYSRGVSSLGPLSREINSNETYLSIRGTTSVGRSDYLYKLHDKTCNYCLDYLISEDLLRTNEGYLFNKTFYNSYFYTENSISGFNFSIDSPILYPLNFRSFITNNKEDWMPDWIPKSYFLCSLTGDKFNLDLREEIFDYSRVTCNINLGEEEILDPQDYIIIFDKMGSGEVYYSDAIEISFPDSEDVNWGYVSQSPGNAPRNNLELTEFEIIPPNKLSISFSNSRKLFYLNLGDPNLQYKNQTRNQSRTQNRTKIIPEVASERAIERLGELNFTIILKEVPVRNSNQTRLLYEAKAKKQGRFLGLFKVRGEVSAEIDAETGEVVSIKKPWWTFLASGM